MTDDIRHRIGELIKHNMIHETAMRDRVFNLIVADLQDVEIAGQRLIDLYVFGV